MLVLSRKANEVIKIGEDITITVVLIRGDKVKLGIEAPQKMPAHRLEVFDSIREENGERLLTRAQQERITEERE